MSTRSEIRGGAFGLLLVVTTTLAALFLALPLLAIFLRTSPATLLERLGDPIARDAIRVTLITNLVAQAGVLLLGTPAAYLLATRHFRGRSLAITLVELPLVLPPAVAGIGLLAAFGSGGLLGGTLAAGGITISYTQAAVALAVAYVSSPFYLRQAIAAFEGVDRDLVDAARTLGASPARIFGRVVVPLALRGLGAGAALAFARGIGEFGATIMFAGSVRGVTQTLPLAIYAELADNFELSLALGALLVLMSGAILLCVRLLVSWTASNSNSNSRVATFGSR